MGIFLFFYYIMVYFCFAISIATNKYINDRNTIDVRPKEKYRENSCTRKNVDKKFHPVKSNPLPHWTVRKAIHECRL